MANLWYFIGAFCSLCGLIAILSTSPTENKYSGLASVALFESESSFSIPDIITILEADLEKRKEIKSERVSNELSAIPDSHHPFVVGQNPNCKLSVSETELLLESKLEPNPFNALFQAECLAEALPTSLDKVRTQAIEQFLYNADVRVPHTPSTQSGANYSFYHYMSDIRMESIALALLEKIKRSNESLHKVLLEKPSTKRQIQKISQKLKLLISINQGYHPGLKSRLFETYSECQNLWALAPTVYAGFNGFPNFESDLKYLITKLNDSLSKGEMAGQDLTTISYCLQAQLDSIDPFTPTNANQIIEKILFEITKRAFQEKSLSACPEAVGYSAILDNRQHKDKGENYLCGRTPPTFFGNFRMLRLLKRLSPSSVH